MKDIKTRKTVNSDCFKYIWQDIHLSNTLFGYVYSKLFKILSKSDFIFVLTKN